MQRFSFAVCGKDVQFITDLEHCLADDFIPTTDAKKDGLVFVLPDGRAWHLEKRTFTNESGNRCTQYIATDVTELHENRVELQEENAQLRRVQSDLQVLSANVVTVTREEEILNTKMRVHDEMGRCLIAAQRYLQEGSDESIPDFEIRYTGDNVINGIAEAGQSGVKQSLSVWGEGTLDMYGAMDAGIWVSGDVTFGKGAVTMSDGGSYAFNYTESLTIKDGGTVYIYCSQGGMFSGDPTVSVLDGSLEVFDGGTWQSTTFYGTPDITDGYVYVSNSSNRVPLNECEKWDGEDLYGYATVWIVSKEVVSDILLGDLNVDGTVNMMDALLLYGGTGGARTMTEEQTAVSDMNSDGTVNMMDALLLYKQASGA